MVEEGLYRLTKERFGSRTDLPSDTPLGQVPFFKRWEIGGLEAHPIAKIDKPWPPEDAPVICYTMSAWSNKLIGERTVDIRLCGTGRDVHAICKLIQGGPICGNHEEAYRGGWMPQELLLREINLWHFGLTANARSYRFPYKHTVDEVAKDEPGWVGIMGDPIDHDEADFVRQQELLQQPVAA